MSMRSPIRGLPFLSVRAPLGHVEVEFLCARHSVSWHSGKVQGEDHRRFKFLSEIFDRWNHNNELWQTKSPETRAFEP